MKMFLFCDFSTFNINNLTKIIHNFNTIIIDFIIFFGDMEHINLFMLTIIIKICFCTCIITTVGILELVCG